MRFLVTKKYDLWWQKDWHWRKFEKISDRFSRHFRPPIFVYPKSYFFCDLELLAKFLNPRTTPSGRKECDPEKKKKEEKIVDTTFRCNSLFLGPILWYQSFIILKLLQYVFYNIFIYPDHRILSKIHSTYGMWQVYLWFYNIVRNTLYIWNIAYFLCILCNHLMTEWECGKWKGLQQYWGTFWILWTLNNICFPTILPLALCF